MLSFETNDAFLHNNQLNNKDRYDHKMYLFYRKLKAYLLNYDYKFGLLKWIFFGCILYRSTIIRQNIFY